MMKKQLCVACGMETWHNSQKPPTTAGGTQGFRCTNCGTPRRSGNTKNVIKINGRIMFEGTK